MTKKPIQPQPKEPEAAPETVTLSARLTPSQRDLVERAANELKWSPAKFVREAAVQRAAEVINASGRASFVLRRLAGVLAEQMLNPTASSEAFNPMTQETETVVATYRNASAEAPYDDPTNPKIRPLRPSDSDLRQIREALETSGSEFVRMVLECWSASAHDTVEYRPQIRPADLAREGEGLTEGEKA